MNSSDSFDPSMLALRQTVQALAPAQSQPEDLVKTLAGSLGPAAPDEMEYFNTFDITWQRFTNEQDNR